MQRLFNTWIFYHSTFMQRSFFILISLKLFILVSLFFSLNVFCFVWKHYRYFEFVWICWEKKKTQNKKKARLQEKWMIKMLTWKTVTVAHKMLLKCFRSHSQCGCLLIISGQVHSLSCPLVSSVNLQNLPPNRYMPSMLFTTVFSLYSYIYCIYGLL